MPAPALVREPFVLAAAPEIVSVVAPLLTSIVLVVAAVRVKLRSVESVAPVKRSVPPPRTRLAAELVDWPMLLADPPFATSLMLSVPRLTVVAPV